MFSRFAYQSLALPFLIGSTVALDLDINSQDSIKSAAKTIASGIVSEYNSFQGPGGIPGLLPDPYYWWEGGVVFGGLIEYAHLTGDDQYDELIGTALGFQMGAYDYMPMNQTKTLGNDDQSFWALAAMTAAETGLTAPNDVGAWADLAVNVFNQQVERWNTESCDGGLKWQIFSFNNGYNYKNSISTGNLFLLSARLAHFTGNATYSEWAEKTFKWTQDIGLVDKNFAVFDGADDREDCSDVNKIQWSAYSATFAEGAALMWNLTDGDDTWKAAVTGLVNSSKVFQNDDSVLMEVACEKRGTCNTDQRAFKGIAIRSWARTVRAAPFTSDILSKMIVASSTAAAELCDSDDDKAKCSFVWTDNEDDGLRGFGENNNALQAVTALLGLQAEALDTNSTNPSGSPTGGSSGNGTSNTTDPAAPPQNDEPNAGSMLTASSATLLMAGIVAMFCL